MRLAVLACVLVGCFPPIEGARTYPEWRVPTGVVALGTCAEVRVIPRKTGKEGLGLTMVLRGRAPCAVSVQAIELQTAGTVHRAAQVPPALQLKLGDEVHAWVAIAFDGDAVWDDPAARDAKLVVRDAALGEARFEMHLTMDDRTRCDP